MTRDGSRRGTDDNGLRTFGEMLRRHRRDAGLSQEGLAELAGLSVDAIAALERGRRRAPRPHTLRTLADALRLDPAARAALVEAAHDGPTNGSAMRPPPAPADELVGRDADLADCVRLSSTDATRLLTLTGPGGVGKTRLAQATALALSNHFDGGVCWVPLAPLTADTAVAAAVASALSLHPMDGDRALDEVAEQIGRRRLLLVLDNCEHVVAAAAKLCTALLERCPQLSVLATSRELLRVPGETVKPVAPLALPAEEWPAERMETAPAVQLFVDRATARGYPPPAGRFAEVARVVRRLDGMPLAIELAAARSNVLTVEQLADELDGSFGILTGGASTAMPRQQSLHAAIEWSHDLLTGAERELFAAMSVFVGGWTLTEAAAVWFGTADPAPQQRADVLSLIGRLADKSLVRVNRDGGTARYHMLAVIREYAHDRLVDSGRYDETARRHANCFVALAEVAEAHLRGPDQVGWLDRLDAELDNLRAAMSWALDARATEVAIRLAGGLRLFCYLRGHYAEGRAWLDQALELVDGSDPVDGLAPYQAKALLGAGLLSFLQCEYAAATRRLEAALRLYRELGDRAGSALVLHRLGSVARERADYPAAEQLHRQSLELYVELGDESGQALAHNLLGFVAWLRRDLDHAVVECERSRTLFRALGDGEGMAWALISLGAAAQYRGDLAEAELLLQESLASSQRIGYREGVAWSLNQLGIVERRRGRTERAVHLLDESLAEHRDLGDRWRSASVLEELAAVASERKRIEYAAFLLGAADGIRETIGAPVPLVERPDQEATLEAVRKALDPSAFAAAWAAGRSAPLHAVADGYPLPPSGGLRPGSPPRSAPSVRRRPSPPAKDLPGA